MQPHIDGVFGPEKLKIASRAFDEAWKELEPWFEDDPVGAEAAMSRLSLTVLALAGREERETNPAKIASSALKAFQWRAATQASPPEALHTG